MTPKELAKLKEHEPLLREALKTERRLYYFLRESVLLRVHFTDETLLPVMTIIGPIMQVTPHTAPCGKCGKPVPHDCMLASPYNSSYRPGGSAYMMPDNGWCIDCVLLAFSDPDTPLYDAYLDPRSPSYDPVYASHKEFWELFSDVPDDDDGPPIVIA